MNNTVRCTESSLTDFVTLLQSNVVIFRSLISVYVIAIGSMTVDIWFRLKLASYTRYTSVQVAEMYKGAVEIAESAQWVLCDLDEQNLVLGGGGCIYGRVKTFPVL